ncbi:sensor histidine kinase [Halovulum sp. GXIMD14794]
MGSTDELRSAFVELVEDAPCGVVVTDPDGRLRFVNGTLKRWLHISVEIEGCRERLPDLMAGAGKLFYETHIAPMMQLQGRVREISCSLKVEGGASLPVLLSGVARRDATGNLVRCDYTIFDARERHMYETELRTARHKAEELAAIVRTSPNAIFRVDQAGYIRSWNAGAQTLLATGAESIPKLSVQELIHFPEQSNWFSLAVERCQSALEAVMEAEDAEGRHFEATVVPITALDSNAPRDYSVVLRDITTRKKAQQRLEVAMWEMKHRVKNTLAVVSGIARQTLPAEFRDSFAGRLHALSRAHDILTDGDRKAGDLAGLLELASAEAGGSERFRITGQSATLSAGQAQSLSMALHELVTNALKYGALSVPDGYVEVDCELRNDHSLRILWREIDGPPVSPPDQLGFGSKMIRNLLKAELNAEIEVDYQPDGLRCEIVFEV